LHIMNQMKERGKKNAQAIVKILKKMGIVKGKILELGCGNGRVSIPLAKRGFSVTGVDISPLYIQDAIKRADGAKVEVNFIQGDIREIDKIIKGNFDVALSIWTSIGYYDKKTDEMIFKRVAKLLKKNGVFLILNTISREFLMQHYCPTLYEKTEKFIILHEPSFDKFRSIHKDKWIFYKREGRDLKYINEFELNLRIYSFHELVEMVEKAGFKFIEAYDSINTLEPARFDSSINMIFKKIN